MKSFRRNLSLIILLFSITSYVLGYLYVLFYFYYLGVSYKSFHISMSDLLESAFAYSHVFLSLIFWGGVGVFLNYMFPFDRLTKHKEIDVGEFEKLDRKTLFKKMLYAAMFFSLLIAIFVIDCYVFKYTGDKSAGYLLILLLLIFGFIFYKHYLKIYDGSLVCLLIVFLTYIIFGVYSFLFQPMSMPIEVNYFQALLVLGYVIFAFTKYYNHLSLLNYIWLFTLLACLIVSVVLSASKSDFIFAINSKIGYCNVANVCPKNIYVVKQLSNGLITLNVKSKKISFIPWGNVGSIQVHANLTPFDNDKIFPRLKY